MARKRWRSIIFWTLGFPVILVVAVVVGCNVWIVASTKGRVHDSTATIEPRETGVVLGTSKKTGPDTPNRHFENRMAAAAALYREGKVQQLLVSGYRDSEYYDETLDMIAKLKELGVPGEAIIADDRGSRTLDSIVRVKEIFGFDHVVIVSDDFHVNRALFIADRSGIEAIALRSETVDYGDSRKVRMREYFARVKAVLDLYLYPPGTDKEAPDVPAVAPTVKGVPAVTGS
jgi:SanA protein